MREPLGPWRAVDNRWEWYYSTSDRRLYQKRDKSWVSYNVIVDRPTKPIFSSIDLPKEKPSTLEIASVYRRGNKLICSGHGPWLPTQPLLPCHWATAIQQALTSTQRLLLVAQASNVDLLLQGIPLGDVLVVSDGSCKDGYGTAAAILTRASCSCKLVVHSLPSIWDTSR